MPTLSRRDAIAVTAGAIAMLPLPASAAKSAKAVVQMDQVWTNLASACREISRDGDLVVARARAHGLMAEDFAGVYMTGCTREYRKLVLVFGDWQGPGGAVHHVTASGVEKAIA